MKHLLIPTLLSASACAGPSIEWSWTPPELLKAPSQAEYEDESAVYLLKEKKILLVSRWRDDSYTQWHQHDLLAILNEKGFEYADVRVPYRAEAKFVRFEARTINPDGTVTPVAASRVYDDELTKSEEEEGHNYKARVFSFPEVKVGSILEYQYIIEEPSIYTSISEYLNDQLPVKRYRLSIVGTDDTAYKIKAYNTAVPFTTDKSGEYWTITWALEDVPPSSDEDYRLGRAFLDPWFAFVVTRIAKFQYSFDYYTDWNHGLRWTGDDLYYDNADYYDGFDPKIDFGGCADEVCRIQRSIDYLTERYPFRGWQNYPGRTAKEATDAKRASGIEKNRLLWWILKGQGIEAKFAFVNRYLSNYRDPAHATGFPGNHLILRVEKRGGLAEPIWIDAACEYCKVGEIPAWLHDSEAMVVHAAKKPPSLRTETEAEIAKVTGTANHQEGHLIGYGLKVDASGAGEVDAALETTGRSCMDQRNESLERTKDEWKKKAEEWVHDRFEPARLTSFEPLAIDGHTCRRAIRFSAPGYANVDEGRLLVPLTIFGSGWDRRLRNDDRRDLQIAFRWPERTTEVIRVEAPEGFEPVRWPKARKATADGVTVDVSSKRDGDAVEIVRSIRIHPGLYDRNGYLAIVAALETFSSIRQDVIELGPKASAPITSSAPGETPRR